MTFRSICVFCGSSPGRRAAYLEAAHTVGRELATRNIRLVYGGGRIGLMGAIADAARAAGGEVIGVIPRHLADAERAHAGLSELRIVASMHERKAMMAELADGFVALPGGFGTLEEFCEIVTWSQLGLCPKPCGLLNVEGYFDPMLRMFDDAVDEGFVFPEHRSLVLVARDLSDLLDQMAEYRPQENPKWLQASSGET